MGSLFCFLEPCFAEATQGRVFCLGDVCMGKRVQRVSRLAGLAGRVMALMGSQEGRFLSVKMVAERLGVDRTSVYRVMTPERWADVEARKAALGGEGLAGVDAAMMAKAQNGDVAAARLVYMRVGQMPAEEIPSLEEMEEMVKVLRMAGRQDY